MAACTKRAQIPFSAWLPAAIAAPTPVSALVHSSTLVTAGVYLLIRFNHLLSLSGYTGVLMFMGTLTIFMAGASAIFEEDIKKIIALSTLRQLGVMIIIVGAQKPILAFYHLISHAYFKAILFMCAGSAIHSIKDYQDIRLMGSGNNIMPIISNVVVVSNIRLCGLPFLRGFYSKDIILECVFIQTNTILRICLIFLGTMLTVIYSLRIMLLFGLIKMGFENIYISEKTDVIILGGTIILFPFSIIGSLVLSWYFFPSLPLILLPFWIKTLVIIAIFSGLLSGWIFTIKNSPKFIRLPGEFLKNIFFMPFRFNLTRTHITLIAGKNIFKVSDSTWLEFIYFQKIFKGMKVYIGYINYLTSNYFLGSIIMYFLLVLSIK